MARVDAVHLSEPMSIFSLGRLSASESFVRNEAVYLVRAVGNGTPSFPELARYFGKDHSTLVAGDRKFRAILKSNNRVRRRVDAFLQQNNERNETCHTGEASGLTRDT